VELINTNPRGDVSVAVDGDRFEVEAGGTLTVTPEQAGEAPHWRKLTDADDAVLRADPEALHWRLRAGDCEVYDLGSGLLAQPENWRRKDDDSDPADPLADGRGGQLVPETYVAGVTGVEQPTSAEGDDSGTEQI
jgi:hypothetical protein